MKDEIEQKKATKLSVYFPSEQYDGLTQMAQDQDRTVAYLIREAVARFLDTMACGPDKQSAA